MLAGKSLPPTTANVKQARRVAAEIREKVRHDIFSMAEFFPASCEAGSVAVCMQLDDWLAAQRIEASTKAGYESAVEFWRESIGAKPLRALRHPQVLTARNARPELTGKTINIYMAVLRQALDLAKRDNLIGSNPGGRRAARKAPEKTIRPVQSRRDGVHHREGA